MCTQILVKDAGGIETCGELWALVGRGNVVPSPTLPGYEFEENECLCHVDIEATADRAGYNCRSGWAEACVDYIWERKT